MPHAPSGIMQANKDSRNGDPVRRAMMEASELPQPSLVDIDPEVPSQLLDDAGQYTALPVDVDAQPDAEADADLEAAAVVANAEEPDETDMDAYTESADDTGDLYGVHTPRAADRDLDVTNDQESFVDSDMGENWLETLGKKAAEGGVEVEEDLDVVDNSDEQGGHHSTESGDRPVADKGSGGPGGL
jgi:hypothetical protein